MEGLAVLIVVVFVLVKFNGLITRSTATAESIVASGLTAADVLAELTEDSARTYAYKVKSHNSQVRGEIKAELENKKVARATFDELDKLIG